MTAYADIGSYRGATDVDLSTTDATYAGGAVPRALYIGVSGDVKVDLVKGGTVTLKSVPVGVLQIQPAKIYKTGTTATNLVALN